MAGKAKGRGRETVADKTTGEVRSRPRTSIGTAAARLALVAVMRSKDPQQVLGRVLVESEHIIGTDGIRLVVVGEPDTADGHGMFQDDEVIALVDDEALRDAARGSVERVSITDTEAVGLSKDGTTVRSVPFDRLDPKGFPAWRTFASGSSPVLCRFNPAAVADLLRALASLKCDAVSLSMASSAGPLRFDADLPDGSPVTFLVMPYRDGASANVVPVEDLAGAAGGAA